MAKNYVHDDYSEDSDANTDLSSDFGFGFHAINDLEELQLLQDKFRKPRSKKVSS